MSTHSELQHLLHSKTVHIAQCCHSLHSAHIWSIHPSIIHIILIISSIPNSACKLVNSIHQSCKILLSLPDFSENKTDTDIYFFCVLKFELEASSWCTFEVKVETIGFLRQVGLTWVSYDFYKVGASAGQIWFVSLYLPFLFLWLSSISSLDHPSYITPLSSAPHQDV